MRRLLPINPDLALLLLRVVLGIIMIYHGWPKLTNLAGTIDGMAGMGVPVPAVAAIFATVAECVGGLLMLLGAFTEYALQPNDGGYDLGAAIDRLRDAGSVPIHTGLPFGHVRDKLTLPVGGRVALDVRDGAARLAFHDYAIR